MLTFSAHCARPLTYLGIFKGLAATVGITIYKGTRPASANAFITDFTALYSSTNSVDMLTHYVGAAFSHAYNQSVCAISASPTPVAALRAGTATWGIIWTTNVLAASLSTTLPSSDFMLVDVTEFGAGGIITYDNPVFAAGELKSIGTCHITGIIP